MNTLLWIATGLYAASLPLTIMAARGSRQDLERLSRILLFAGFALHSLLLGLRALQTGYAPMMGRYETVIFFGWSLALLNLVLIGRYGFRQAEYLTVPLIMLAMGFAAFSDSRVMPLPPILQSVWFEVHVVTSFFAYALFTLAAAAGALWLWQARSGHQAPALLGEVIYRATLWGFVFFSLSMVLGAVWGYLAWGAYWRWEAKSAASLMLWFFFAGVLHSRYSRRWRGRPAAVLAVIGLAVVLFTYLGVGIFLENSHRM